MILDHFTSGGQAAAQFDTAHGVSRRAFIRAGAAAGGGLMLSLALPIASGEAETANADAFAPNAFIRIDGDGQIILTMPYVEMGQGTYTSIPMLIAEELEVNLKQVRLEHAPPNEKLYANPLLGVQATGNSNAIRGGWQPLRQAGAVARTMLIAAAAKRWNVDSTSCRAQSGEVRIHRLGDATHTANLPPTPPACPFPKTWRSNGRKISSSSARRPSGWIRRPRSTVRLSMASMSGRRA
jgi:isoquinoline 1-oxidoreductase beta subunit